MDVGQLTIFSQVL